MGLLIFPCMWVIRPSLRPPSRYIALTSCACSLKGYYTDRRWGRSCLWVTSQKQPNIFTGSLSWVWMEHFFDLWVLYLGQTEIFHVFPWKIIEGESVTITLWEIWLKLIIFSYIKEKKSKLTVKWKWGSAFLTCVSRLHINHILNLYYKKEKFRKGYKFLRDYHKHTPLWYTNRRDMLIMTTISEKSRTLFSLYNSSSFSFHSI